MTVFRGEVARPPVSFGEFPNQGTKGTPAEAVDIFFDRLENLAPRYVGRMNSLLTGYAVAAAVFALLTVPALQDRHAQRESPQPLMKHRWMMVLAGAAFVSLQLQGLVSDKLYVIQNIKANKQHVSLVFWLGEYARALRAPSLAV